MFKEYELPSSRKYFGVPVLILNTFLTHGVILTEEVVKRVKGVKWRMGQTYFPTLK